MARSPTSSAASDHQNRPESEGRVTPAVRTPQGRLDCQLRCFWHIGHAAQTSIGHSLRLREYRRPRAHDRRFAVPFNTTRQWSSPVRYLAQCHPLSPSPRPAMPCAMCHPPFAIPPSPRIASCTSCALPLTQPFPDPSRVPQVQFLPNVLGLQYS